MASTELLLDCLDDIRAGRRSLEACVQEHPELAPELRSRAPLASALRRELAARERAAIDAEFAGMADDDAYQAESEGLTDEFGRSDWEAFRESERRP